MVTPVFWEVDKNILSKIDKDALKIIKRLHKLGYTAYLVGGCVRDLLLGKEPKDFDIVTNAESRAIRRFFANSRIIGKRFELAQVFFKSKIIEVSTFRQEDPSPPQITREGKIRKTENRYGSEETDAFRRDLTINALFLDPLNLKIIDYVGGFEDLKKGVIRTIGPPIKRFTEDPVRIYRALRHSFRTGFQIDQETHEAILISKELLTQCPPVRLFDELKKDFAYNQKPFTSFIAFLDQFSVLPILFPPLKNSLSNKRALQEDLYLKIPANRLLSSEALVFFLAISWLESLDLNRKIIGNLKLISNDLNNLFSIVRPPRSIVSRVLYLLSLIKKIDKAAISKNLIFLNLDQDTGNLLATFLDLWKPELLDLLPELTVYEKDFRSNPSADRKPKAPGKTFN